MIRVILFFLILISGFAFPAKASDLDMNYFKLIPILDEGRLKPIDSFARLSLKKLSGKEKNGDQTAVAWLAETVFDPAKAISSPVFKVENDNIRHQLGLKDQTRFLYSFADLVPGLKKTSVSVEALARKERGALNKDEKDLMDLHDKAFFYTSLLRSLSLLLPMDIYLPEKYQSETRKDLSYLDLRKLDQNLLNDLERIIQKKGEDFSRYNDDERKTAILSFQLQLFSSAATGNDVFKIVPPQWDNDNGNWHAPWETLQKGEGSPATAALFAAWKEMGEAYLTGEKNSWLDASGKAKDLSLPEDKKALFTAETIQNSFPPFKISTALYAISLFLTLLFFSFGRKDVYLSAISFLGAGSLIHLTGIALRVVLLERPPVGTLYESMLFVSLSCVFLALVLEKFLKNGSGILTGSITGLLVGLLSFSFIGEGDSMTMLTAVLNTNFWLATHVLCITMGYGWCILAALLAHMSLISSAFDLNRWQDARSDISLHIVTIFALFFPSIGTILGGIWADQSWGRFWGWDPKENGALLIVLWLIWLLHGKLGNQLNRTQFLAGLAFLNVIVAFSWVGVNLLGVGLHSYGFADGYFYGLEIFTVFEMVLIGYLWRRHA